MRDRQVSVKIKAGKTRPDLMVKETVLTNVDPGEELSHFGVEDWTAGLVVKCADGETVLAGGLLKAVKQHQPEVGAGLSRRLWLMTHLLDRFPVGACCVRCAR